MQKLYFPKIYGKLHQFSLSCWWKVWIETCAIFKHFLCVIWVLVVYSDILRTFVLRCISICTLWVKIDQNLILYRPCRKKTGSSRNPGVCRIKVLSSIWNIWHVLLHSNLDLLRKNMPLIPNSTLMRFKNCRMLFPHLN